MSDGIKFDTSKIIGDPALHFELQKAGEKLAWFDSQGRFFVKEGGLTKDEVLLILPQIYYAILNMR